jgi:phenylacetate-CoA ligase
VPDDSLRKLRELLDDSAPQASPECRQLYAELLQRQSWDRDRLLEDQLTRVARLIAHASRNVAHYRDTLRDAGPIASLSDLAGLPTLSREVIRDDATRLVTDGVNPADLETSTTGGTTGVPLLVYRDPAYHDRERAHTFAAWRRFGVRPGARVVVVVGRRVTPDGAEHRLDESTGTLWLDADPHHSPAVLTAHAERLREFRPALVRGYSSTLSVFARHATERRLALADSVVATGTSSEVLYPWQAEAIREAFGVPNANLYGHTEHAALAVSCPASPSLHVDTTYGLVEIVDDDGRPVDEPGVVGEIVATGLGNTVMPLIRYRTGDRAAWDGGDCDCGLSSPRISMVEGRTADSVLDSSGRPHVFGSYIYGDMFGPGAPFGRAQYRQDEPGVIVVTVVPKPGTDPREVAEWVRRAHAHVTRFRIVVSLDGDFRSTRAGKQPLLAPPAQR